MIPPTIEQAQQQIAASLGELVRECGPQPGDALIDKLWGEAMTPLTRQERHDLATILYAAQRACGPIDGGAMARKAVRLDALMGTWNDVFGGQS